MAFNRTYNQQNVQTERGNGDFAPLPAGEYNVQIAEATDKVSKSSGKDMIELTLEVIDTGAYAGRKLWVYIVDDQYADQKIYDIFRSAGKSIPPQITRASFLNLVGRVKTKQRSFNGEIKAEVNYWIPKKDAAAATDKSNDIPF